MNNNHPDPDGRTTVELHQWQETQIRRQAEARPAKEEQVQARTSGNDLGQMTDVQDRADHADRKRQKFMSGVSLYPTLDEIMELERQAPRSTFESFDGSTDKLKRRPVSGIDHYPPMEAINEHERSNPQALDSIFVDELRSGQNTAKEQHDHSQRHEQNSDQDIQAEPWDSDGGLARPEALRSPAGQRDRFCRLEGKPYQKGPIYKSAEQPGTRGDGGQWKRS